MWSSDYLFRVYPIATILQRCFQYRSKLCMPDNTHNLSDEWMLWNARIRKGILLINAGLSRHEARSADSEYWETCSSWLCGGGGGYMIHWNNRPSLYIWYSWHLNMEFVEMGIKDVRLRKQLQFNHAPAIHSKTISRLLNSTSLRLISQIYAWKRNFQEQYLIKTLIRILISLK